MLEYLDYAGLTHFLNKIKLIFSKKTEAIKNITRAGTTFTATRADGSTFTFNQQDTTYSAATTAAEGLAPVLSGNADTYLNGLGNWSAPNINAATSSAAGLVPALSGNVNTYLNGTGTWTTPTNTTYGVFSASDSLEHLGVDGLVPHPPQLSSNRRFLADSGQWIERPELQELNANNIVSVIDYINLGDMLGIKSIKAPLSAMQLIINPPYWSDPAQGVMQYGVVPWLGITQIIIHLRGLNLLQTNQFINFMEGNTYSTIQVTTETDHTSENPNRVLTLPNGGSDILSNESQRMPLLKGQFKPQTSYLIMVKVDTTESTKAMMDVVYTDGTVGKIENTLSTDGNYIIFTSDASKTINYIIMNNINISNNEVSFYPDKSLILVNNPNLYNSDSHEEAWPPQSYLAGGLDFQITLPPNFGAGQINLFTGQYCMTAKIIQSYQGQDIGSAWYSHLGLSYEDTDSPSIGDQVLYWLDEPEYGQFDGCQIDIADALTQSEYTYIWMSTIGPYIMSNSYTTQQEDPFRAQLYIDYVNANDNLSDF